MDNVGRAASDEINVRLLIAYVVKCAASVGRRAVPLLCLSLDFFRRCYFIVEEEAEGSAAGRSPLATVRVLSLIHI